MRKSSAVSVPASPIATARDVASVTARSAISGATDAIVPAAMVNLLGSGDLREARLEPAGLRAAMVDPTVHLHLYDKRRVFERRKMGHVTAIEVAPTESGDTNTDAALERARAAVARLRWADAADDAAEGDG